MRDRARTVGLRGEELSDPLVVISIKEGLIDDWQLNLQNVLPCKGKKHVVSPTDVCGFFWHSRIFSEIFWWGIEQWLPSCVVYLFFCFFWDTPHRQGRHEPFQMAVRRRGSPTNTCSSGLVHLKHIKHQRDVDI